MSLCWSQGCLPYPVPWPSHSWWCQESLHLQGDDLAGQFSQRFAFWSVNKCEDAMRIQSHIVISKAMHHHLTMPVISLVLVKGKPTRFWWITSGPRHTFQWIKTYTFLVAWESMNSYCLLVIPMGKTVLSLEQLLLVFLLRVQCRVTCRLQTWRKSCNPEAALKSE